MAKLDFPTKLICLTKTTLTTIECYVKIQNDCSTFFEMRQGLRQRDVLSTLLFNFVLDAMKLQTMATVFMLTQYWRQKQQK
jgi:hypothetical protein